MIFCSCVKFSGVGVYTSWMKFMKNVNESQRYDSFWLANKKKIGVAGEANRGVGKYPISWGLLPGKQQTHWLIHFGALFLCWYNPRRPNFEDSEARSWWRSVYFLTPSFENLGKLQQILYLQLAYSIFIYWNTVCWNFDWSATFFQF